MRCADDCNVYVKNERSGRRVMASLTDFIERKMKLKVNRDKSAVDRPRKRKFLGLTALGRASPTQLPRRAGCEAHKSGPVRGAPGRPGSLLDPQRPNPGCLSPGANSTQLPTSAVFMGTRSRIS